jgi:hypothetical protein
MRSFYVLLPFWVLQNALTALAQSGILDPESVARNREIHAIARRGLWVFFLYVPTFWITMAYRKKSSEFSHPEVCWPVYLFVTTIPLGATPDLQPLQWMTMAISIGMAGFWNPDRKR